MVNENLIPKTETVYEIKDEYEIPSFEEFIKTYESDSNLNYDDLNGSNIGESKGYGPCPDGRNWRDCPCSREELQRQYLEAVNNNNITIKINITNIWINTWPGSIPQIEKPKVFELKCCVEKRSSPGVDVKVSFYLNGIEKAKRILDLDGGSRHDVREYIRSVEDYNISTDWHYFSNLTGSEAWDKFMIGLKKCVEVYDENSRFLGDPDNWERGRIYGRLYAYKRYVLGLPDEGYWRYEADNAS